MAFKICIVYAWFAHLKTIQKEMDGHGRELLFVVSDLETHYFVQHDKS